MTCYSTKNTPTQSFYNKRSFFRFREMFLLMNYPVKKKKKSVKRKVVGSFFRLQRLIKDRGAEILVPLV